MFTSVSLPLDVNRSHNRLLMANRRTWEHFKLLRTRYYSQTHSDGRVLCRDSLVMRKTSDSLISDSELRKKFVVLADGGSFHADDVDEVYGRYVTRAEGLIGRDTKNSLNESLHAKATKRKGGKLLPTTDV